MWQQVFGTIGKGALTVVLPAVATMVGSLAVAVLKQQLAKAGIELSTAQQTQIAQLVENAIRQAEELSRRQVDRIGEPLQGATKREIVLQQVQQQLPKLPREAVEAMIDARLPLVRMELAAYPPVPPMMKVKIKGTDPVSAERKPWPAADRDHL